MSRLKAVILAAGAGTRMKSKLPKVVHKILGKTMIDYVIEAAKEAGAEEICVVVGHKSEIVKKEISYDVEFVLQEEQLGTGHAVMMAKDFVGNEGNVLILFGDTPLITGNTLTDMVNYHSNNNNAATLLSTIVEDPTGYGRIIRDESNTFIKSIEHKDASEKERTVKEINSGMYCFNSHELNMALDNLTNDNSQGEYYLPDTLKTIIAKRLSVNAMITNMPEDILGVNSQIQLYEASRIMQKRINYKHMENGVTLMNPTNTYISKDASIDSDTVIYPNCIIEGKTTIGSDCIIGPNSKIVNSRIVNNVNVESSTILDSFIDSNTNVGPYAYIRPNSRIGSNVKIGDFVEIKNSNIGNNTKASHLTYIGDADVGSNVNFGCGTVVVNYDGVNKNRTVIEDNAFIGCNTNLVSPVKVHNNAYTAAGSTITKDVPEYSLGIGRARQVNIQDWVRKKR
ncbi:bifunctional protein GlmU [Vallitalea longa]|uniref:Bifunctional protein GlmU n=1 Tax=Vallitalea longa TaxID=2936439 RepID=A0A9W5YDH2_9FIRM|nr:bifunctional UDP-N-acetylglucosamine diphosphorylase/glucosamine-1-phosphate N-acetyltransferase GlmU [Vallitalea longa]GKX30545.1 bifunctional protein GlmU [Vallitalea longa]